MATENDKDMNLPENGFLPKGYDVQIPYLHGKRCG